MRKKKLLSTLLVGAQLATLVSTAALPASAAEATYKDSMTISKVTAAPEIDGDLTDSTWKLKDFEGQYDPDKGPVPLKDHVQYDIQWDDEYLYFAVAVKDDDKIVAGHDGDGDAGHWGGGDGVRLFFSPLKHMGDKSTSGEHGDIDFKPVIPKDGNDGNALLLFDNAVCSGASAIVDSMIKKNEDYKVKIVSDTAWNMEMRISWKDLRISPAEIGTDFAFDFRVENEMNEGSSYRLWTYNNTPDVGMLWNSTVYYGLATLGDLPASDYQMTAQKIAKAPTIDGKIDDWGALEQEMLAGAQGKDAAKFDIKHDNEFLYFAAQVSKHSGPVQEGPRWVQGDCISLYFDPTMHRGDLSTSLYDLQLGYGYNKKGEPTVLFGDGTTSEVIDEIKKNGEAKCSATSDGWILEAKIPKAALHLVKPYFGFNVQVENNPEGVFINWADGSNFYLSTVDYGKLTLARDPATSLTTETTSLDIPVNTSVNLTDIKFLLNGSEKIDASFYDMKISFDPENIIAIEKGRLVAKKAGSTNITFSVDDQSVTIPVKCEEIALITIEPIGPQNAYVNVEKNITVKATTNTPTTLVYSAENLPEGASFNPETHTFTWTPKESDKGDHVVTFKVGDKDSTKSEDVTITVKETPVIEVTPIEDKVVSAGKAISFLFDAKDSLNLPLSAKCTNLPEGARFSDSSGKFFFTWIPTAKQVGSYALDFEFTNGATSTKSTVNIKVVDKIVDGITFEPVKDPDVDAGDSVSFKVNATCSNGQPVVIETTGALPEGASFDQKTNTFSWKTSSDATTNSYPVTFRATSGDYVATMTVTIHVSGRNSGGGSIGGGGIGGGSIGGGHNGSIAGPSTGTDVTAQKSKYFKDMDKHLWASASVDMLYEYGIVKGVTADTYCPQCSITRADFVLLLMRTFKFSGDTSANFSDVSASAYYAKEVAIARSLGLINGSGNNQFRPTAPISRQDMMLMLDRAIRLAGLNSLDASEYVISKYDDAAKISSYAKQAVANMVSMNLIEGTNNKLMPTSNTTRAEIAVILHRMLQKYGTALLG